MKSFQNMCYVAKDPQQYFGRFVTYLEMSLVPQSEKCCNSLMLMLLESSLISYKLFYAVSDPKVTSPRPRHRLIYLMTNICMYIWTGHLSSTLLHFLAKNSSPVSNK